MLSAGPLLHEIRSLAVELPVELVNRIAGTLEDSSTDNWNRLRAQAFDCVTGADAHGRLERLLTAWRAENPTLPAATVALALRAAVETAHYLRAEQELDLVWTGPTTKFVSLRRTEQALLQLIRAARESLHIVSFAVYKVGAVADALVEAAARGVKIALYLETPDESEGRMTIDTVRALGQAVAERSTIYIWPREKREDGDDGRPGSLHAKVAVADRRLMLISSANLTGHAMTLNMEMGLLLRGGPLPGQVADHLLQLRREGVFARIVR